MSSPYFPEVKELKHTINGRELVIRYGDYAFQADGAVTVSLDDTVVLATASMGEAREGTDFFPLMVDYEENFYAAGKIKGSKFVKRSGRPSDNAILTSRLIDRPIRPLFPKGMVNNVQVICKVLSADLEVDPGTTAMIAASAAVCLSGMPFDGPIAGVRVGLVDGELILNPTYDETENGDLDLVVAGTEDAITMVEAGASEVPSDKILEALEMAHNHIKDICGLQKKLMDMIEVKELEPTFSEKDEDAYDVVMKALDDSKLDGLTGKIKAEFKEKLHAYEDEILAKFEEQIENEDFSKGFVKSVISDALEKRMRENILTKEIRLDGRKLDEIRPLRCTVGVLPRPHGTGMFQRGETQVVSFTTLGSPGDAQIIDTMDADTTKRYIHYYSFPPFSVGDVKPLRGASRREIGHGDLAERALLPVQPSQDEFPYTILLLSEVLSCNGSSSMASVCGSTLSLMHAGVPIARPVSGIAMGLITDGNGGYKILSDIQGMEDFAGDMDFYVTGTSDGITALQMDIKVKGLSMKIMKEALDKADEGRDAILQEMLKTISEPNNELSPHAPIIESFKVDPDYIGGIIGKGGETIQAITGDTDTDIAIEDDGTIIITAPNKEAYDAAKKMIDAITYEPEPGEVFENAKVVKVMDFGAFVEFVPGKQGLVHISKLAPHRVENVTDVLNEGDEITVKLLEVDREGRYNLSHKDFYKED